MIHTLYICEDLLVIFLVRVKEKQHDSGVSRAHAAALAP